MSFVFYVFLLFIDEIQLGICQTAVLDIAVFSTVFRIVFLYRCRYVWIIRSGLGAFAVHTVRIIREYVQIRQQFCVDLFYDLLCQHTVRDFLHPARPQSRKQQLSGFLPVQIR